ncbi:MAG: Panacea domain-containing protein [Candidatus Pacebacteria bacterium]|nr:Panacea domain-containing protein [Candidatus Paceibacterota bacterium]
MPIHSKKYKQAILYLCSKLDGEIWGKKKLAKLLYFVDFDFFEKYQKYFTGDKYRALPMGPFPVSLSEITSEMEKEGMKCLKNPQVSIFSKEEIEMLDRIIKKYGDLNGKQLEDLTRAEAPYIGTEPKGEILYELAFYRGTDFNCRA